MRFLIGLIVCLISILNVAGQNKVLRLDTASFGNRQSLWLADSSQWIFKPGNDITWAEPELPTTDWDTLRPANINTDMADENGRFEGWFRIKISIDSTLTEENFGVIQRVWAATDIFLDGELITSFGNTGLYGGEYRSYDRDVTKPTALPLIPGKDHVLTIHVVDQIAPLYGRLKSNINVIGGFFNLTRSDYRLNILKNKRTSNLSSGVLVGGSTILTVLFWMFFLFNRKETHILFIAISATGLCIGILPMILSETQIISFEIQQLYDHMRSFIVISITMIFPLALGHIFKGRISRWHWYTTILAIISFNITQFRDLGQGLFVNFLGIIAIIGIFWSFYYLISERRNLRGAKWSIVIGLMISITSMVLLLLLFLIETLFSITILRFEYLGVVIAFLFIMSFPLSQLVYVCWWQIESRREIQTKTEGLLKAEEEKRKILDNQKAVLESEVKERTSELNDSLENLKSTQSQLIQSEKMASLGELTAGIAHEIQNPLNFVNNFSEVNKEMLDELKEAVEKNDQEEVKAILKDLKENEDKVAHHGKRAEGIVKSMLQHSRTGSGEKEETDINALCDEYLRLAYHGFRAKDKSFNSEFELDLDPTLPKVNVVSQDLGRVLLNLINNAFQAVRDVEKPLVTLSTRAIPLSGGDKGVGSSTSALQITVSDNGPGIPDEIKDKIFEPFFTTKPTGEGTGLGLSMSYDIVTKGHGGNISVESDENGTIFSINLPR